MMLKLAVQPNDCVLEMGFGPGELLNQLGHAVENGKVYGLDFSATMLKEAAKRNQHHIQSGCLELCEGCSRQMPYSDSHFDKVVTGNTLYFWQPPEVHLQEVLRVLKPNGKFVMGFRDKNQIDAMQLDETIFARYTLDEVEALLDKVGFTQIVIEKREDFPVDSYVAMASRNRNSVLGVV